MNQPTCQQIMDVVTCLYELQDIVEVRRLPCARSNWHIAIDLAVCAEQLTRDNRAGQNIYIGANPRPRIGARGDASILLARCIFADFDGVSAEEAISRIRTAGLPMPTLMIWSGHGVHCYWRLVDPFTDLDRWSSFQMDLASLLNSDPVVFNAERIMRLAGFVNHKPPPSAAYVIFADHSLVYPNADLLECIPMIDEHWIGLFEGATQVSELKADVAKLVVRKSGGARDGVIDEWNRQVTVADMLLRHHYSVNGTKFTRPGKASSDGYSGHIVTCRDGIARSIHFSGNDPLNDRKFAGRRIACGVHDAFDVFRLLECAGDQSQAVRACANALGIERKTFTDAQLIEACLLADSGEEFERLFTGDYGALTHEQALERLVQLMRKHTDFDKQIGRVLNYIASNGGAGAA